VNGARLRSMTKLRSTLLAAVLPALVFYAAGCGSAVRTTAHAIEVAALATATAGDAISLASEADARSTCPRETADPAACLAGVSDRWAPVDLAFSGARVALGAWYASTVAASRAGDSAGLLDVALGFARAFAGSYADLRTLAAALGLSLPDLPAF
jgi:hypothetical protein